MEDLIIVFRDAIEGIVNNYHEDKGYNKKSFDKLKKIYESIVDKNIKDRFNNILIEMESTILLGKEESIKIISEQYEKTQEIVVDIFTKTLEDLQNKLAHKHAGIEKFNIVNKSEYDLILVGSYDEFSYAYDVEILFAGVDFILCPGYMFKISNFRIATQEEIIELNKFMNGYEKTGIVTCLENTNTNEKYYIVAQQIQWKFVTVALDENYVLHLH